MPSDAVAIVLSTISAIKTLVHRFEVHFECEDKSRYHNWAFVNYPRLSPGLYQTLDYSNMWRSLQELLLRIPLSMQNCEWLPKLIRGANCLQRLSLTTTTEKYGHGNPLREFYHQIFTYCTDMPPIQRLHLAGGYITMAALLHLAQQLRSTFHTLSLKFLIKENDAESWNSALHTMSPLLPHLRNVHLLSLYTTTQRRFCNFHLCFT